MTTHAGNDGAPRGNPLSPVIWGAAACLLLLPWVAMQFTHDVVWTAFDFIVFGTMLAVACGAYELAARMSRNTWYRAAAGIAVLAGFFMVWVNLAVGIIGSEHNPANLMFAGVLGVGVGGALIARFRALGMAYALVAMALAQALVGAIVLVAGWGYEGVVLSGCFVAAWLASSELFRQAARQT